MGFCSSRQFVRTVPAAVALVFFLIGAVRPVSAGAAVHPMSFRYPSCFCRADFNRDGLLDGGSILLQQGSTFIHLSLSGKRESVSLRAGKGVVNVVAVDIDGDGYADLVALRTDLRIKVWLNNRHGNFVRRSQAHWIIFSRRKSLTRDSQQANAFCCSFPTNDGARLAGYSRITFTGPGLSYGSDFESGKRSAADPFLALIHPRGPPFSFV